MATIAKDKILHYGFGAGAMAGGFMVGSLCGLPVWATFACGWAVCIGASFGKEMADTQTTGFSVPDLIADALGGMTATLALLVI